ncbi:MAG TPA: heat-inducible transcriptional repressor HrcA [Thermodesulfobacteriota bacterium]|nr:heat-inducible transcriptional repressor HrcA [Thermodesulfobacteriota bacterium]
MAIVLNQRGRSVLNAIIRDYIETAEPVGSKTVAKKNDIRLSPATIRNIMADLEDIGLIAQPHISAGRVPTEEGLRFYVHSILELRPLAESEKRRIQNYLKESNQEVEELLKSTSRMLAVVTEQAAIVSRPKSSATIFKHIEFIRLRDHLVLTVLVTESGLVQNKILEIEDNLSQSEMDRLTHYLNELLSDLTLDQLKKRVLEEMKKDKDDFDALLAKALEISNKAFQEETIGEVYIEGRTNLMQYPEFSQIETLRKLFRAFEEKNILIRMLEKSISASGIQIFIGSETQINEMGGCSVITASYNKGKYPIGTLGVIGPTRMNYDRVIPIVDYTARVVSKILENKI